MASKKLKGAALAQSKVIDRSTDNRLKWSLPVNEGFSDPNEVDRTRGVKYDPTPAPENGYAERGIGAAVLAGLFPAASLKRWIVETAARKRGLPGLAADLVAVLPNPNQKPTKKLSAHDADVAAMLRSLQRAAPAKKQDRQEKHETIRKSLYRERIARLRLREARDVVIGVRGWWLITELSKPDQPPRAVFRVFNTDPSIPADLREARAILEAGGSAFIETVIASANGTVRGDKAETLQEMIAATQARAMAELLSTHELRVEVSV